MKVIEPIKNRIVAKRVAIENVTESGILVAKQDIETSNTAIVEFVGPDVKSVKPGDTIIFIDHMFFKFLGNQYITLLEDNVLGVVK